MTIIVVIVTNMARANILNNFFSIATPVDVEEIPMAKVYQQIINLTKEPPCLRTDNELDQLVPWLRKKSSSLFQDLENSKQQRFNIRHYIS